MKIQRSVEWWMAKAELEAGEIVSAGGSGNIALHLTPEQKEYLDRLEAEAKRPVDLTRRIPRPRP